MPVELSVKSMQQTEVIVVLLNCFPLKNQKLQWPKYLGGKKQCEDIHCQVHSQKRPEPSPTAHTSSCPRNSLKEPNFVTLSMPWKVFSHNQSREQRSGCVPTEAGAPRSAGIHGNRNSPGLGVGLGLFLLRICEEQAPSRSSQPVSVQGPYTKLSFSVLPGSHFWNSLILIP